MDFLFEQKFIQNTALGAHLLWVAAKECYEQNERRSGVSFPLIFLILPLVFHRSTAKALFNKKRPGALFKAISENREIPLGLQKRMEGFAEQTLSSLNMCVSSRLLYIDTEEQMEIVPLKSSRMDYSGYETKMVINATKRVGQCFSELNLEQICSYLNIRF
jgi:hypothetical protein